MQQDRCSLGTCFPEITLWIRPSNRGVKTETAYQVFVQLSKCPYTC
jgi:hypothetical protein